MRILLLELHDSDTGTRVLVNLEHVAAISDVIEMDRNRHNPQPVLYDTKVKVIGSIVQTISGAELAVDELIDDIKMQIVKGAGFDVPE